MRARIVLAVGVPLALLLSLAAWAFASPVGSSPDDDYHMASIWCGQGIRDGLCEPGDATDERRVPAFLLNAPGCYAFHPELSASCPRADADILLNTNRGNFTGGYPPVYYGAMSIFASTDFDASILTMRVTNAVIFTGLVTALFFLLPRGRRGPLVWGTLATMVPLGMFLVASVNPSSWAITSAVVLWIALTAFYRETRRSPRIALAAIAVLATVMGAGARSDAAVYAGIAVLVSAVFSFERTRRFWLSSILGAAIILVGLFFFFTSGQSAIVDPGTAPDGPKNIVNLVFGNLVLLPQLWAGVFGTWGLGWLDTILPGSVWIAALLSFAGLLFWGLRRVKRRKAIALGIVLFALIAIPMYIYVHDGVMVGAAVQPRYVLPLMIMLAGIALSGFSRDDFALRPVQVWLVVVALSLANSIALQFTLRRYITGDDIESPNLDAQPEWWWNLPFGPNWVWIIGSLVFAGMLVGAVLITRNSRLQPLTSPREAPVETPA